MTNKSTNYKIEKEYVLQSSVDEVWDCLADEDISSVWQTQDCIIGENVGDKVELFGSWVTGKILSIKPKSKLSYTWLVSTWGPETEPSKVEYRIEKIDEKTTKVNVKHWDLPNQEERDSHDSGWDEQFFDIVREFLKLTSD